MNKLTIHLFDVLKFEKLRDNNEYLSNMLTPVNGLWYIETDDTREVERLLSKNRIRYNIKR